MLSQKCVDWTERAPEGAWVLRIAAELTDHVSAVERKSQRTRVAMEAGYRDGPHRGSIEVVDISPTGLKIESHLTLAPDTYIWVKLPGLEAWQARIAWVKRHEAGCEFIRPLHPAVFERVVAACAAQQRRA
jgi:hypothetical protein